MLGERQNHFIKYIRRFKILLAHKITARRFKILLARKITARRLLIFVYVWEEQIILKCAYVILEHTLL